MGIEVHCKDIGLEDPATVGNVNKDLPEDEDAALNNGLLCSGNSEGRKIGLSRLEP